MFELPPLKGLTFSLLCRKNLTSKPMEAQRIPPDNFVFLQPQKATSTMSDFRKPKHESPLTILIVEDEEILYQNFQKAHRAEFNFISTAPYESVNAALRFQPKLIFINLSLARALQVC